MKYIYIIVTKPRWRFERERRNCLGKKKISYNKTSNLQKVSHNCFKNCVGGMFGPSQFTCMKSINKQTSKYLIRGEGGGRIILLRVGYNYDLNKGQVRSPTAIYKLKNKKKSYFLMAYDMCYVRTRSCVLRCRFWLADNTQKEMNDPRCIVLLFTSTLLSLDGAQSELRKVFPFVSTVRFSFGYSSKKPNKTVLYLEVRG